MKARITALVAVSVVLGASAPTHAQSHDGHDHSGHAHAQPGAQMDAAMQEWAKTMMPGEPHRALEYYAGDWTFVNRANMAGMKTESRGTARVEMMMGGRYVHAMHKSEMMGMPFEGAGITGYDNLKKEYFNVWFDNMGTGVMVSRGQADKDGVITVSGRMPDPAQGGDVDYRMVSTITGPDTYTFEMFMETPNGEERVMEILYTRVKS